MNTLGNIIWHIPFLGFITAISTWIFGLLLTLTIFAAPIGLGLMELGKFLFWPFGNVMVNKNTLSIEQNILWRTYSTIVAIIYFPFGLLLTIASVFQVIALFFSIIGIPVALVIAKSLGTFLNPVNKKCVDQNIFKEIQLMSFQSSSPTSQFPENNDFENPKTF